MCAWVTIDNRPFVCTYRHILLKSPNVTKIHEVGDLHRVLELMDSSNDGLQARRNSGLRWC